MAQSLTLLQFQSPWQGRTGFARYHVDTDTGTLSPARKAKTKKLLRKGQKNIDGLVLFPSWPTRKGLIVTPTTEGLCLTAVRRGRIDPNARAIHTADVDYHDAIAERGLYRRFTFSNGVETIEFSDLSARLVSSHRTAYEIFPTADFSPFARLASIIRNPDSHSKLIRDLNAGLFDYPCWGTSSSHIRLGGSNRATISVEG
jgi:hypothetical protein